MLKVDDFSTHVSARVLEFFSNGIPWFRGLWNTGFSLTLAEVLEGSEAVRRSVLAKDGFRELTQTALKHLSGDYALPLPEQKKLVQSCLAGDLRFESPDFVQLRDLHSDLSREYLLRWAAGLHAGDSLPSAERTARAIASHLLDSGLSRQMLHRWWSFEVTYEPVEKTLADIVESAHALVGQAPKNFEILVVLTRVSRSAQASMANGLTAKEVSKWLRAEGHSVADFRQQGGILLNVESSDRWSAAEIAIAQVRTFANRIVVGTREGRLGIYDRVWVKGYRKPIPVGLRSRGVDVLALRRENKLYPETLQSSIVDAALELVEPLDTGPAGPAVAGGWAAIEALLGAPGESKSNAAGRLASIVALSYPRAELTTLSYRIDDKSLLAMLAPLTKNRERAELLATWIEEGQALGGLNEIDRAAMVRVTRMVQTPGEVLHGIRAHIESSVRRLYRVRNLVLHGGYVDAVALKACLRTVSPLVGAGLDRVAHAWYVDRLGPIELAARASTRLELVGTSAGKNLCHLLES